MSSEDDAEEGSEVLPFQMDYLPEFVLRKCQIELNETPEGKAESLHEFRRILQENKITSGLNFHHDLLVTFLRRNKYRIDGATQQLENFVSLHRKETWLFKSIPDDLFTSNPETLCLYPLPKRTSDGCVLLFSQIGKWDPDVVTKDNAMQLALMIVLQQLRDPMTQINGFKIIHDFKGTTFKHMKYGTPHNFYLISHAYFKCLPARYKEMHMVNVPHIFKAAWKILKCFFSEKINSRIYFHSSPEELFDHFPRSVIPDEYGGTLVDSELKDWLRSANEDYNKFTIEGRPNYY